MNPVCNKNYTESAGPLQFKQFVNRYMKNGKWEKDEQQKNSYKADVSHFDFNILPTTMANFAVEKCKLEKKPH